jgi:hypothetical protein
VTLEVALATLDAIINVAQLGEAASAWLEDETVPRAGRLVSKSIHADLDVPMRPPASLLPVLD